MAPPPPPAMPAAQAIAPAAVPRDSKINRDLMSVMGRPSLGYFALLGAALLFMHIAGGIWVYQVYAGLGVAGYTHPIFWGVYIVTFVFWVGIAHAGTLISAIQFGNLRDPQSRVAKDGAGVRSYHALHALNTRPAVSYLAKVLRGPLEES